MLLTYKSRFHCLYFRLKDIIEVVPVDAPETTTNLVPETAIDESQNELEDTAIADVSAAPLESQEASAEEGTKGKIIKRQIYIKTR